MAKIADAFSLIRNGANIKQGLDDSGYPITRIETISNRTVDRDKMGYAGITDITKYSDYVLQDGDILMSHINSETHLGKVARYEKYEGETIIHGMNLLCLRPNKNLVDSRYAFYYLSSEAFLHQIPRITKKSVNQASFNVAALKELTFPISSMEVQQTVADILDKANELIALRKEQLAKLDELVKARFIELFGTETEFDRWPCCTIGDVADVCVGVVIKPTQYYTDTGIPAFRSLNIGEMRVKDSDWVYFTEDGHQKNQKSVVHKNDVLVVRSGAPGTACVATEKYDGYNAVDIIIAHPDNSKVNSIFLAAFTNMPHGMNQIRERTGGAAQQHFNVGGYKAMRLIMPSIELQNQYAAFVEQSDKSKVAVQKALDEAQLLFDSLMQKYFE